MKPRILGLMTIQPASQKCEALGKRKAGTPFVDAGQDFDRLQGSALKRSRSGRCRCGKHALSRENFEDVLQNSSVMLRHHHVRRFALEREKVFVVVLQL